MRLLNNSTRLHGGNAKDPRNRNQVVDDESVALAINRHLMA